MIPRAEYGLINHTAEGYMNIIEACYHKMESLDSHIARSLPRSVFIHNMVQLYHVHLMRIAGETGQQGSWDPDFRGDDGLRLIGGDTMMIPAEIYCWLKGVGKFKDPGDFYQVLNVPLATVPKPRRQVGRDVVEGGDFGPPTDKNHNAYEISIAPMVTRRLIEAQLDNAPVNGLIVYTPLAPSLMPPHLVPNENLLGYDPNAHPWHRDTVAAYANAINSWARTGLGARLGFNACLWYKQNNVLSGMSEKMWMIKGMPPTNNGSFAMIATLITDDGDPSTILRRADGRILSYASLDHGTRSGALANAYRRTRKRDIPGTCFLTEQGAVPDGWLDTINASYDMLAPFAPTFGDPNFSLLLNHTRYETSAVRGRYNVLCTEIVRLTTKTQKRP